MSGLRRIRIPHVRVVAASLAALTLTLAVGCGGKDSPSSPTPTPTAASPTLSAVTPNSGSTSGGTAVTITGANFATGATATIGGTPATGVTVVSATSITATTPAHAAGAVDVVVTNPGGRSGTLTGAFTYTAVSAALTIASLSPNSGPISGGTSVTITGTNFVSGATVRFGSAQASNVTFVSSTSVRADTPAASSPGSVDVVVTLPGGASATLANGFAYTLQVSGNWAGTTPQTGNVTFTVNGTTITAYSLQYVMPNCPAFSTVSASNLSVPVSNNSFSRTVTLTSNGANVGTLTFSGSFSSNSVATGNIQVTETSPSVCPGTLSTTWRATKQ
jgi:IPT/TIG domain-containing protein